MTSKTSSAVRETTGVHEVGLDMTFYGCSKCPSTLYKRAPGGFPGVVIVFAGGLDGGDGADGKARADGGLEAWGTPQVELWVKHRLPWVGEVKGAKQCQEFE
ncbi:uncharacterized protein A1O9_05487 [Exophiala aquamarina CBS 119918]|uniref:CENP-V/GFA domain-containing protein n=1 Tax=Exophiala aquamarina CBS 119918 TaxID=1182545 RepID=A0A072PBS2_9EURO|nr:uncharacterized protein A1O9_05487 [Exophiala aquamarina CBS 119918]KEF57569.1 hypothetical protein A1O9_05487 [Exophiala aquamarina CBS 119918]